jgi:hypothetical protein
MTNNESDKQAILQAINTLVKCDPDFARNIQKLAQLAQRSPFIYKQAVNKLNSL